MCAPVLAPPTIQPITGAIRGIALVIGAIASAVAHSASFRVDPAPSAAGAFVALPGSMSRTTLQTALLTMSCLCVPALGGIGCAIDASDDAYPHYGTSVGDGTKPVDGGTIKGQGGFGGATAGGSAGAAGEPIDPSSGAGGTGQAGSGPSASGGNAGSGSAGSGGTQDAGANPNPPKPVDCSGIKAKPGFELCGSGLDYCDGVFTNGAGCVAFCAAAGLKCASRYGGSANCGGPELNNPLACEAYTGNQSDWCHCQGEAPGGAGGSGGSGPVNCPTDPGNPAVQKELDKDDAVYTQRNNWVVTCSAHAYTGQSSEHQSCDSAFQPDGSRKGTATFTFSGVPAGAYDVLIESKHSENRNKAGALFRVNEHTAIINQVGESAYVWDLHGRYCLSGTVVVVLDSTVNTGSDAVSRVRLKPAY